MGRLPRIYFEGAIYHVTARGDNKEKIFDDIIDRRKYFKIARESQQKYGFDIYAYVLMPNHVHFLIKPSGKASISVIMHRINSNYAKYYIWKYKRVGHIFQGRFFGNIVEKDTYLLSVVRYIHLNPVRAQLAERLFDWKWSSIHHYLGTTKDNLRVDTDFVLSMLSDAREEQIRMFNQLHEMDNAEEDKALKEKLKNSFFIGSDGYVNSMNQLFGRVEKKRGRPKKLVPGTIFS